MAGAVSLFFFHADEGILYQMAPCIEPRIIIGLILLDNY